MQEVPKLTIGKPYTNSAMSSHTIEWQVTCRNSDSQSSFASSNMSNQLIISRAKLYLFKD